MPETIGSGSFMYEPLVSFEQLPAGMTVVEIPDVDVDREDNVYLLTRNPANPIIVLAPDGRFLRTFGAGTLSEQTHGLAIAPDGTLLVADNWAHTITRWSPEGELLMTLGTPGEPAEKWSGDPFNLPTDAAVSPQTGDIYITDGYGTSRIHVYAPEGGSLFSWGSPGIDPGQFIRPHNIAIDDAERVYVADRHCHRVQIFAADGTFLEMWNNIYLPCALGVGPDDNVYIGELAAGEGGMAGGMARESPFTLADAPGIGHRLNIYSREGELLARLGDIWPGEAPGQFIAPHGIAVDSRGDIYVSEVATSIYGRHLDPPRELRCLSKLRRIA